MKLGTSRGARCLVLAMPLLIASCSQSTADTSIRDETAWLEVRPLLGVETISVECDFDRSFSDRIRQLCVDSIHQELSSRGFGLQPDAEVRLAAHFRGPWEGARGLPISSRYAKVRVELTLENSRTQERWVRARVDGIIDEGDVSFLNSGGAHRRERAIKLAIGKIGRELYRLRASEPALAREAPEFPHVSEADRVTLAVIDLAVAEGIPHESGIAVANQLRSILSDADVFVILDRENIRSILGERDFALVSKCDATECLVSFGKLLHAQKMMHGRISKVERKYVVYLTIVDVSSSRIEASAQEFFGSTLDGVMQQVEPMLRRVVAKLGKRS